MNWKRKYYLDMVIAIFIILIPILFYSYLFIEKGEKTFTINSQEYELTWVFDLRTSVYYLLIYLVPLFLFSIWFITQKSLLKYSILSPIAKCLGYFIYWLYSLFDVIIDNTLLNTIIIILVYVLFLSITQWIYNKFDLHQSPLFSFRFLKSRKNYILHAKAKNHLDKIKNEIPLKNYLKNLFFLRSRLSDFPEKESNYIKNRLDIYLAIFVLLLPVIYYTYQLIPEGKDIKLFYMSEVNNGFRSSRSYFYAISLKMTFLLTFIAWYITNQNWYKMAIFIPIIIYTFQLYEVAFGTSTIVDEVELIKAFPLILVTILFTLFLSKVYKYSIQSLSIREQLGKEINKLIGKFAKKKS